VERGDNGGLFGKGVSIACCLANVDPDEIGLIPGLPEPGDRRGSADMGEGGTKGKAAKTESARDEVVFALTIE
jgi:hypothetical protein